MVRLYQAPEVSQQHFDFVVVGAGSAGCVVASRLAEDPIVRVALIEAGDHATEREVQMPLACPALQHTKRDWWFTTEASSNVYQAMKGHCMPQPRGKALGGSSILNYMAYVRGCKEDYDGWERMGFKGWGWKDVLPYFVKAEDNETLRTGTQVDELTLDPMAHGVGGPLTVSANPTPGGIAQAFVRGAVELGFERGDYNNGDMHNRTSIFQQTIRQGKRCDTATAYLFSQPNKSNLTIITNAQATRLLFSHEEPTKVVGVDLLDPTSHSTSQIFCDKEVVLSCGAFGSPQVLMLSGIGPKKELEEVGIACKVDLVDVGKNLEDHPCVSLAFHPAKEDIGATNSARAEKMPRALPVLLNWLFRGKGPLATSAYDAVLFYRSDSQPRSAGPDNQIGIICAPGDDHGALHNLNLEPDKNMYELVYGNKDDPQGAIFVSNLLHAQSRGHVALQSDDALAHPKIDLNLLGDRRDIDSMIKILRKTIQLGSTKAMSGILLEPAFPKDLMEKHGCADATAAAASDAFLVDIIKHYTVSIYHPTGTAQMGKVVDERLRVLGNVKQLRIADASIFPTTVSGNTNAPCIMVGEKAAALIQEDHCLKPEPAKSYSKKVPALLAATGFLLVGITAIWLGSGKKIAASA